MGTKQQTAPLKLPTPNKINVLFVLTKLSTIWQKHNVWSVPKVISLVQISISVVELPLLKIQMLKISRELLL